MSYEAMTTQTVPQRKSLSQKRRETWAAYIAEDWAPLAWSLLDAEPS